MTESELGLRQTEVGFEEVYDLTGNRVVGFRARVEIEEGEPHFVVGGRVRNREDLRRLFRDVADYLWECLDP